MAKYIIDVPEDRVTSDGKLRLMDCVDSPVANWIYTGIFAEPFDRKAIENEAWEFVVKCLKMDGSDFYEIFDSCDVLCLTNLSYQEAKEKYEVWKKSKEEIRVGDEVIYNSRTRAVVLEPETEERYGTILTSKFCTVAVSHDDLEKTGRHFEEVEKLLKKWEES